MENNHIPAISPTRPQAKRESSASEAGSKNRYKFWALAGILVLAFWSMFTGSVNLKWSANNLTSLSGNSDFASHDDLDILEVEAREKLVRHMWDMYTQTSSRKTRLPKFWQEAFKAAYEHLTSDVPHVRDAAFSEIAKMSLVESNNNNDDLLDSHHSLQLNTQEITTKATEKELGRKQLIASGTSR